DLAADQPPEQVGEGSALRARPSLEDRLAEQRARGQPVSLLEGAVAREDAAVEVEGDQALVHALDHAGDELLAALGGGGQAADGPALALLAAAEDADAHRRAEQHEEPDGDGRP